MEGLFDLNIEQVLENWGPEHAVREIIANALDEQTLTDSQNIEIYKKDDAWHIRDYGRGLQYSHFTQNENDEKLSSPYLIGKFGVGLKDALAVLYRRGIVVEINSKHANITLKMAPKAGFDIQTLHAVFVDSVDKSFEGTEFILRGVRDYDIEKAKRMFLRFHTEAELLETTKYGDVYRGTKGRCTIYVNGVRVATEDNFLFSYNITNINSQIRKALNRERSNVGRMAYADTIKKILKQCISNKVLVPLIDDLENLITGHAGDEAGWIDVSVHAARTLAKNEDVVFVASTLQMSMSNAEREILEESGKRLIVIPDNVFGKIEGSVQTFDTVYDEYKASFSYNFVNPEDLRSFEKRTWALSEEIISFLENWGFEYDTAIKISETIVPGENGHLTQGAYDPDEHAIIIRRSVLEDPEKFCGALLHEFAHFQHGYPDNTRDFENDLTDMLGAVMHSKIKDEEGENNE